MSSTLLTRKLSYAEYLDWEAQQEGRNEFIDGEVFAMSGAVRAHNVIIINLVIALGTRLRDTRCEVFSSNMKLRVEAVDAVFYPDIMVNCSDADRQATRALSEPKLIIEVLSPPTGGVDQGRKSAAYRTLATLDEYLLIDPGSRSISGWRRSAEGAWQSVAIGADEPLVLASLGVTLDRGEVFRSVE